MKTFIIIEIVYPWHTRFENLVLIKAGYDNVRRLGFQKMTSRYAKIIGLLLQKELMNEVFLTVRDILF